MSTCFFPTLLAFLHFVVSPLFMDKLYIPMSLQGGSQRSFTSGALKTATFQAKITRPYGDYSILRSRYSAYLLHS
jgi:hypothetical protein